jgi:hypothetical protein
MVVALCFGTAVSAQQVQPPSESPVSGTPITATAPSPEVQARLAFEAGVSFANEERWGEALRAFQRSSALFARPNSTFNVATTLVRLGRHVDAVAAFEQYLSIADPVTDAARVLEAQQQRAVERAKIAQLIICVSPAQAELRVDGRSVQGSTERRVVPVDPGVHDIEVMAPQYETYRSQESPLPGATVERTIALQQISWGLLEIVTSVRTARVTLDEQPFSIVNGATRVPIGARRVHVEAQGYESVDRVLHIAPGQHLRLDLALQTQQRSLWSRPWFWAIGAGSALAITGVITAASLSIEPAPFQTTTGIVVEGISDR